jgi:hypothetical protein
MISLMNNMDDALIWHNRERWSRAVAFLDSLFREQGGALSEVVRYAHCLSLLMEEVSPFIQRNTSAVCPGCKNICCVNRHGYYDHRDLVYVFALGASRPAYRDGVQDNDPCQFLSGSGCTLKRPLRPFRCNWYFCSALLAQMGNGPARPYRAFVSRFQEIIEVRRTMLEAFTARSRLLAPYKKESPSL